MNIRQNLKRAQSYTIFFLKYEYKNTIRLIVLSFQFYSPGAVDVEMEKKYR